MNSNWSLGRLALPPWVAGLVWLGIIAAVDWWSGPELLVSVLYLPGILWIAWHYGRAVGLAASAIAAVVWVFVDLQTHSGYSHPWIAVWNGFARLMIFIIVSWLASEIRNRKSVEGALRRQSAILSSVLDSMSEGVVVAANDGKILICNQSATSWFGRDLMGAALAEWLEVDLLGPDGDSTVGKMLRKVPNGGEGSGELLIRNGELPPRLLGFNVQPLRGVRGAKDGVVMVFTDLTERRGLEREVAQAAERERWNIGQLLHDGVCQELVSIGFAAETVQMDLERLGAEKQADSLAGIAGLVRSANRHVKSIARGMFPAGLDESLSIALQSLADAVSRRSSTACDLEQTNPMPDLGREIEGHVFLILREAVVNAERHSQADRIRIVVTPHAHELVFEVIDEGIGFNDGTAGQGIGQRIMKYRAGLIGADLEIQGIQGSGTYVRCRIPIPTTTLQSKS